MNPVRKPEKTGNVMEPVEQDSLDMDVGEQNSENQPEETDE